MAEREPALVTPFWVRIAAETNLSPGWLLIAFPAVLYPIYLLLEVLFGRGLAAATDFSGDYEAWITPVITAGFGYVVMMLTYVARGILRDLEDLRSVLLGGETAHVELRRQFTQFERSHLWIGGLVFLLAACLVQELVVGRWTRLLAGEWSLRDASFAIIILAVWLTAGRGAGYIIDSSRVYSRIGERHVVVDLLDLGPLSPLTRHGLRTVLLFVLMTAAWVIAVPLGAPPAPGSMGALLLLVLLSIVPVAIAAFLLPVRGLRRHIRTRKAEKLVQLRSEIRRDEKLVSKLGPESAEAGARLPGLLAYAKTIESVREWPFDAPTLTRFFLYVAIPLGSWVGGALVERLLGAALD